MQDKPPTPLCHPPPPPLLIPLNISNVHYRLITLWKVEQACKMKKALTTICIPGNKIGYPNCVQTTVASCPVQTVVSHTVPNTPSKHICTLPCIGSFPSASLTSPSTHCSKRVTTMEEEEGVTRKLPSGSVAALRTRMMNDSEGGSCSVSFWKLGT